MTNGGRDGGGRGIGVAGEGCDVSAWDTYFVFVPARPPPERGDAGSVWKGGGYGGQGCGMFYSVMPVYRTDRVVLGVWGWLVGGVK